MLLCSSSSPPRAWLFRIRRPNRPGARGRKRQQQVPADTNCERSVDIEAAGKTDAKSASRPDAQARGVDADRRLTMDMSLGPEGADAFAPNAIVTCDYVEARFSGASRSLPAESIVRTRSRSGTAPTTGSSGLGPGQPATVGVGHRRRPCPSLRVTCRLCSLDHGRTVSEPRCSGLRARRDRAQTGRA